MTTFIRGLFSLLIMKIGFTRSTMLEESRIALMPEDLERLSNPSSVVLEKGYGASIGISDFEYQKRGAAICSRERIDTEVLVVPKRSHRDISILRNGQTILGWFYVSQTPWLEEEIKNKKLTVIAFEYMQHNGRNVFWKNSRIAGRIGILDALVRKPVDSLDSLIAVLGNGNVGNAAKAVLSKKGYHYDVYHHHDLDAFKQNSRQYDMVVNCLKWHSNEFLINREDLVRMKWGCYIVDLSSDGIEGSVPRSIYNPLYWHETTKGKGLFIYNNEHTPTLVPRIASKCISEALTPYLNDILAGRPSPVLERATVYRNGLPCDKVIKLSH